MATVFVIVVILGVIHSIIERGRESPMEAERRAFLRMTVPEKRAWLRQKQREGERLPDVWGHSSREGEGA
jgi:hypothetical protein